MGKNILIVEDDERIRTAVRLVLEEEGYAVVETESGEAALEVFAPSPSDVVLIDIMLPGIDGFEVCRRIRRLSEVPIIMVTARDDSHDVVAGLEAGADDYLSKPFDPKVPVGPNQGTAAQVPPIRDSATPTWSSISWNCSPTRARCGYLDTRCT